MRQMQMFAFSVPKEFEQVLEKVDQIVIETKTSRSDVVRNILFDHFGITRPELKHDKRSMRRVEQW